MRRLLSWVWLDESGEETVEYALILALVALASCAAWAGLSVKERSIIGGFCTYCANPIN